MPYLLQNRSTYLTLTNTTRRFWYALLMSFAFIPKKRSMRKWFWIPLALIGIGFLLPQDIVVPVKEVTTQSWNVNSIWACPWGISITHNGIVISRTKEQM